MNTTYQIAAALSAVKTGSGWMAGCPAHDDTKPSLSICETKTGKVLFYCHAGCSQIEVLGALRNKGIWGSGYPIGNNCKSGIDWAERTRATHETRDRTTSALAIWRSSVPAQETGVETYLRSRGIQLPVPTNIRFHPGLKHPAGGTWPAMVALVTDGIDGKLLAVHRTFLAVDCKGKAPVSSAKMMLGPCRGGVVRLTEPRNPLLVGEGIETSLTAMQETGHAAWAGLSTSGLRTLELPPLVQEIIILADGDRPGEAAAQVCGQRWKRQGRRVRIARPPLGFDFNDMLSIPSTNTDGNGK